MRTKTILTLAALSVASIATAVAQTVYSVNAVGYVNVTVPAGKFALLANPLNQPTNNLASVLPGVPANTVVYIFNATGGFDVATARAGGLWTGTGAADLLNPGAGFFIKNAGTADMTITFVGEVPQGTNLTVAIPAGFSLISSIVPQAGKLETDLKFPSANGDVAYLFDNASNQYTIYTRRGAGVWTGGTGEPALAVAQGMFYKAAAAATWTRSFNVNQ